MLTAPNEDGGARSGTARSQSEVERTMIGLFTEHPFQPRDRSSNRPLCRIRVRRKARKKGLPGRGLPGEALLYLRWGGSQGRAAGKERSPRDRRDPGGIDDGAPLNLNQKRNDPAVHLQLLAQPDRQSGRGEKVHG